MNGNVNLNLGSVELTDLIKKVNDLFGTQLNPTQQQASHALDWASLSHEKFCLFVLDNENYSNGWFAIAKNRALKYTPDSEHFLPLTPDVKEEILGMPCIFAKRNRHFTKTDDNHPVLYGRLKEIILQGSVVRFQFEHYGVGYQQTINANMELFGLLQRPLHNQLDVEHWCICQGDLPGILAKAGVNIW